MILKALGAIAIAGVAVWSLFAYRAFDADRDQVEQWTPATTNREPLHPEHQAALEERDRDE